MEPWRLITQLDGPEWICLPLGLSDIRLAFQRRLDQPAEFDDQHAVLEFVPSLWTALEQDRTQRTWWKPGGRDVTAEDRN